MPAYNNYFPIGYQPANYALPYQQSAVPQPITTTLSNGIVWVQGEAGAKAYPVAAGNSMLLMDGENEQFYIKSTDMSGMPMPLRIFSYKEITSKGTEPSSKDNLDLSKYITKDEFERRLNALKMPLNKKLREEESNNE